ncbi:MAG: amidohydrolase [Rhodanobacter denitrificans]|uniref:Amidohydrolase n=1 Tax=Rhodanobacter denitrificans TaxID=666685 RepID=A0A2W5K913_9GAMM|nr:MAG: amidohydrolase [Rhodanobacter denitrificans]
MRLGLVIGALSLAIGSVQAAAPTDRTSTEVQRLLPQITAWRRDLHQHPELSNREVRTAKIVADELRRLGYEVRTGIAHTGVTGVLRSGRPGPKLAIRADMDALPVTEEVDLPFASRARGEYLGREVGVMHACGHDTHTAMTLGVAAALAAARADWSGEVMLIFQPAEEGAPPGEAGGAPLMVEQGLFETFRPDAIFGMHVVSTLNAGTVALREGPMMASSDTFRITVHGRQSHGATPWKGIDPIVIGAQIVSAAQTIVSRQLDINAEPAVVTFGIFNGGQRFNIVPDSAELHGTVRAFDETMRQQALSSLRRLAEHTAAAGGATIEAQIPVVPGSNPVNVNDPALTRRVRTSLERALGAERVLEAKRWTASEDFPHLAIAAAAPSVYFNVGATPPGQDPAAAPSNHSPRFFVDEAALETGTRAMLQASLDYLGGSGP